jgi:hypothetical protein
MDSRGSIVIPLTIAGLAVGLATIWTAWPARVVLLIVAVLALVYAWRQSYQYGFERFRELVAIVSSSLDYAFGAPAAPPAPQTWRAVAAKAQWPQGLPLPGNQSLKYWPLSHGKTLDADSSALIGLAERVYAPLTGDGPRALWQRSILGQQGFDRFDPARREIGNLLTQWGSAWGRWGCDLFLASRLRRDYWNDLKAFAYLEIALALAIDNPKKPSNTGWMRLGNRLRRRRV